MAYILNCKVVDESDGTIKVGYQFFGETEEECEAYYREHLGSDEYFAAAEREDRVIVEEVEEVDELPDPEDYEDEEDEG